MKRMGIIDIQPQINRGRLASWELVTAEEFDRYKQDRRYDEAGDPIDITSAEWFGRSLVAIDERDFIKKLLLSRPVDDDETSISSLDAVGDWAGYGDGENLTKDADNYVKGSASINWDINADGGTTAGIYNASLDTFDITDYIGTGSIFVWAYITSATNLTNFIIRVGSSASNYYYITITTNNEGASFYAGWNLLRFDFANKTETGTVDTDACDYVALYMTKDAAKVSETDYRFDNLVLKKGKHYWVRYYTKYGWQSSAGTYLENSTADTDYLNVDTDEYDIICEKAAELAERHLKNRAEAGDHRTIYKEMRDNYILENPSEAMVLMQTYHDMVNPLDS